MKKLLVVYFTQTGQAKQAIDAVVKPFEENNQYTVDYLLVKPKKTLPHPWSYMEFFDIFPETVRGVACELEPVTIDPNTNYDLIVVAYQPWFLSVCVPINSFLQTEEAKKLFLNKPVVTIINCRNMWLGAQEKMKQHLKNLHATLVGNITFVDRSSNLVSLVTVFAAVLSGEKGKFLGIFPKYGNNEKDLAKGPEFGKIIMNGLESGELQTIQPQLNDKHAVSIRGNLLLMEGRGRALFPLYANYISKRGTAGSADRRTRVRIFGIVLPTAILILSPILTILSRLVPVLARKKFNKEIAYYSQNTLR